jgi:hypothetical protein
VLLASNHGTAPTRAADPPPPDELYQQLVTMDRQLARAIDKVNKGELTKDQIRDRIDIIEEEKRALVAHFFDQPVNNLGFADLFLKLDCIDKNVVLLRRSYENERFGAGFGSHSFEKSRAAALERIHECKKGLIPSETAYGVRLGRVFDDLDGMDVELMRAKLDAIFFESNDKIAADLEAAKKLKQDLEAKLHAANPPGG